MSEGVNVRFKGELKNFIESRIDVSAGLYNSTSEYIRDLVRRDYEAEEARKWAWLRAELKEGVDAAPSDFKALDAESIIQKAREQRGAHAF
jgi:antitoxin ParD1/3/4